MSRHDDPQRPTPVNGAPPPATPISEEMLSAYVDDELDAADQSRVQAWLHEHPDDRQRVAAWRDDRTALAELFNPVLNETPPATLVQTVWQRARAPRWARAAAAVGLLVAGGLVGGAAVWEWQQRVLTARLAEQKQQLAAGTAQGWVQRAAFAHSVYVAEPRHAVEVKAQEEHLSRWLTRRISIPVKLFDLQSQGYELVGGRLLPDGPGKSAQLMYQDSQKRRVTVYLRKPEEGAQTAFRYEQQGPTGLFYWVEAGAGYALVGDLPKAALLALAQAIYTQLPNPAAEPPAGAPGAAAAPSAPVASAPR